MSKFCRFFAALIVSASLSSAASETAPKYIFYYIGDGMGMGHVLATQTYNRMVLGEDKPLLMMQFPVAGIATTYSASSPVTDSAAAGTALATGSKTKNGMLGMNADTVSVSSVAQELFAKGYGVGIVTSVYPDDATPGAFFAHQPSRNKTLAIGLEAAASGYQFIGGSNLRSVKDKEGNSTGLIEAFAENGVDYVRGADAAASSTSSRIFMVNTDSLHVSNIGYTIDSLDNVLTLPLMTSTCLNHLEKWTPDAFFMMVEGGNIDHAAHANDGATVIKEILNFNEALEIAYKFYLAHPDETLIVVTADHDTGGMSIGSRYLGSNMKPQYVDYQRQSKDRFNEDCKAILRSRRIYTWEDMKEKLEEDFGFWKAVPVTEKQTATLKEKFEKTFELRNSEDEKTLYANYNEFSTYVFQLFNDICGIGWISTSHTGNYVPVYAIGVGADKFSGIHDNADLADLIREVSGLK